MKDMEVFNMAETANILQNLIPITQFNKGQASKIFDRLSTEKKLIVLKNGEPSAVILSPREYERLIEIEEDYILLAEANKRIDESRDEGMVSFDTIMADLNISENELLDVEEVDIEREIGWKDGKIVLEDCPLQEALDILSKKYHVTFRIINDELQNSRFTGTIKNQGVEQIIKNLSISCRFNYRIVKNNSPENDGTRATIELY